MGLLLALPFVACSSTTAPTPAFSDCTIPLERFTDGGIDRSSIPALTNPRLANRLNAPEVGYILTTDQVIGFHFNGQPVAIPLKLLWYHEVLNFELPGERLTVTYSPLTGSAILFDPASSGAGDFEVSSYVLDSNLVMDDGTGTLYPQMLGSASCGPRDGVPLARVPYEQISYAGWLSSFPLTHIGSRVTGHDFLYTLYPYGSYRNRTSDELLYPISSPIDPRRPPKERVLGVPAGTGGIAFSLPLLAQVAFQDQAGTQPIFVWAANGDAGGRPVVAFYNSLAANALVYQSTVQGQPISFEVVNGSRRDVETGSIWNYAGRAVAGPMQGTQLARHQTAYHAYWFAWADVHPDTRVWTPSASASSVSPARVAAQSSAGLEWDVTRDLERR